jgi:hypothetical protein
MVHESPLGISTDLGQMSHLISIPCSERIVASDKALIPIPLMHYTFGAHITYISKLVSYRNYH